MSRPIPSRPNDADGTVAGASKRRGHTARMPLREALRRPVCWLGALAMGLIVYASNRLVEYPINDWLTWAAFTYPFAFLVTDVVNRRAGPGAAMAVVTAGFAVGVPLSLLAGDARIAIASGSAFLIAQSLDVGVFDRLRARRWWIAPGVSSTLGSVLDTVLFFGIAFAGTGLPWLQWAAGDLAVKLLMVWVALLPYRLLMPGSGQVATTA